VSYSVLRTLKKEDDKKVEKKFIRHLVIGEDLFAVAHTQKLQAKLQTEDVGLIVEKKFSTKDILPKGASTLRGEANVAALKELYPEAIKTEYDRVARFIKEGKFKKFGGRSKPETLLWGEHFYVDPRVDIDLQKLFPFLEDEALYDKLPAFEEKLKSISKIKSEDLVQNASWAVECASGTTYECEHLYFAKGPAEFLNLVANKSSLSSDFIEWCEATQTPATLYHHWSFTKPVIDRTDTIFVPYSYTHEWGHAVVEFVALEGEAQEARMTSFIEPEQTSEEDLGKKIRLYKRNLEKICPDVAKFAKDEYLALMPTSVNAKNDDAGFQNFMSQLENLIFIGEQGASIKDCSDVSHLMRGLKIYHEN
tara:strand:+ start:4377 stop:5471 length:1095 start_codon:yes stop_codon:yes gene_type:complete